MAVTLNAASRAGSPAAFFETLARPTSDSQSSAFQEQLLSAIRDSLAGAGLRPEQIRLSSAEGSGGARQIIVSFTEPVPAASSSPAAGAAAASAPAAAASAPEGNLSSPIEVLRNALKSAGLDPDRFSLTESREVVGYPGGSYLNHVITAEFGNGLRESYGVQLMLRNPQVTVVEMRRLLASQVSG
jgi:hypothetical protein